MRLFAPQRFAHLALYATLTRCVLACGADTDHGPTIGSPTGPQGPVVIEAGGSFGGGQGSVNPGTGDPINGTGGTLDTGSGGTGVFGTAGSGVVGTAGSGVFGTAGAASTDPFGIAGSPSSAVPSFGGSF